MIKEFREFVFRGNVVDLAVAVVIGAAFGAIITSLVEAQASSATVIRASTLSSDRSRRVKRCMVSPSSRSGWCAPQATNCSTMQRSGSYACPRPSPHSHPRSGKTSMS